MGWDKSKPIGATKVKDAPAIFTNNWLALEESIEYAHEALDSADTPGRHVAGKWPIMMYGTQAQILAISSTTPCAVALDTGRRDLCYNNGTVWVSAGGLIPVGTKMLFYADTAPTGWTLKTDLDDKLVFITKGSAAAGQTGGGAHSAGSWTITGFGGTSDSHTLTEAELPAHTHAANYVSYLKGMGSYEELSIIVPSTTYTGYTGGGEGHTHNISSNMTQVGTWRPTAYCCIICTKD